MQVGPAGFDPQPELEGARLHLRPLREHDLDGLHAAASDPEVWAGHPARDRHRRDVFEPYFRFLLGTGTTLVVIDKPSGRIIGSSRYYTAPDRPGSIAIGFTFLNNAFWGGQVNRELKELMLGHAFQVVPEVWFDIAPSNIRSQKATLKLGATHVYDGTFDLAGSPADWMCFRLTAADWERVRRS